VHGNRPVTVLTVDDHPVFRRAERELLGATAGFEQVAEAASGRQALELAGLLHPDLVLVELRMPGMDGIETARRLAAASPGTVVVLVSVDERADLPADVEDAPVAAYVRKQDLSKAKLAELWRAHGTDAATLIGG
jgi:DNA-binding NarL/FixJ family response regulator